MDLVGAIAWDDCGDHIDIAKVMVSPDAMRQGLATALLEHVREQAPGRAIEVMTGRDNAPAVALYAKHGFASTGDEQVPPGIWITRFRLCA